MKLDKKATHSFVAKLELIYTVSFTVCVVNCADAIRAAWQSSAKGSIALVVFASTALLLVAFRLIFATKALHDFLDRADEARSIRVVVIHSSLLILQSFLVYAASLPLKDNQVANSMLWLGWALLLNGVWLWWLHRFEIWSINNIVLSSTVIALYWFHWNPTILVLVLFLNSLIDFYLTSDWYLGGRAPTIRSYSDFVRHLKSVQL